MDIKVELEGYSQYWMAGRELMNVQVTLGQDDRSSSCNVVLADPTGAIASDLIKHTLTQGGIVALPKKSNSDTNTSTQAEGNMEFLLAPEPAKAQYSALPKADKASATSQAKSTKLTIREREQYRQKVLTRLNTDKALGIKYGYKTIDSVTIDPLNLSH